MHVRVCICTHRYASQSVVQIGLLLALPQLMEYCGAFGPLAALKEFVWQQLMGKVSQSVSK